jgi:hypothetical protein
MRESRSRQQTEIRDESINECNGDISTTIGVYLRPTSLASTPITGTQQRNCISHFCVYCIRSEAQMLTRPKVLLPLSGIVVSLSLLIVGSKQVPIVLQDSPPFVAPATQLCSSINAPASFLLAGLVTLAESLHCEQIFLGTPRFQIAFLVVVAVLWFVVGFEVELRLTKAPSAKHRLVAASVAASVALILMPSGIATWQQDQVMLSIGCVAWSAALTLFFGVDLTRLTISRLKAG